MAFTDAEGGLKGPEMSLPSSEGAMKATVEVEPKMADVAGKIVTMPSVKVEKPKKSRFSFPRKSSKRKVEVRCHFAALVRPSDR